MKRNWVVMALCVSCIRIGSEVMAVETSDATITLLPGENIVSPIVPDDSQDLDNGKIPNNQKGPLQINHVSSLDFGQALAITDRDVTFSLANQGTPFYQVTDLRGTGEGWVLKVALTDFISITDDKQVIKGASVLFQAPRITSTVDGVEKEIYAPFKKTLYAGISDYSILMRAPKNTGLGTWAVSYPLIKESVSGNDKIMFHAKSEEIEEFTKYRATLKIELLDGPVLTK